MLIEEIQETRMTKESPPKLTVHSLDDLFEEGKGEEMIGHVAGVKHESSVGAALLCRR